MYRYRRENRDWFGEMLNMTHVLNAILNISVASALSRRFGWLFPVDIAVQIIFDRRMWTFLAVQFISDFRSSHFIIAYSVFFTSLPPCIKRIDVKHNVTILDIRIHENIFNANRTRPNQNQNQNQNQNESAWNFKRRKKKKICEWYWYPVKCALQQHTFTSMHSHSKWSHLNRREKKIIERYDRQEKSHTSAPI